MNQLIPPESAMKVITTLHKAGFEAYLVGGCVRDFLMGLSVQDYDIATSATPQEVTSLFPQTYPVGIDFGTILVVINRKSFEVTSFRKDIETDGRHAKVEFTRDLTTDLERRDFTVNAIAYDPVKRSLIDPFHGEADIGDKILRTVGDPQARFHEDYLRILRGLRFAARFNLSIDPATYDAIVALKPHLTRLSAERVREELLKALTQVRKPSSYLRLLSDCSVMSVLLPEVEKMKGVEQNKYHLYDCFDHTLRSVDSMSHRFPLLRFAMLLHDIGKPRCKIFREEKGYHTFAGHDKTGARMARLIMTRLKFSNEEIERVANLIDNHLQILDDTASDPAIRRYINRLGHDNIKDMFRFHFADVESHSDVPEKRKGLLAFYRRIRNILKQEHAFAITDLVINGDDLIELGLQPSPLFSKILKHCLELVLDDPANNQKDILLSEAKKMMTETTP